MSASPGERLRGPLRRRGSLLITCSGLVLAAGAVTIGLTNSEAENHVFSAVVNGATISIFVSVGLFARRRDPESSFGSLLLLAGVGWFFVSLASADSSLLYSVGRLAAWIEEALLIYLFLAYPGTRPETGPARAVVGVAIGALLLLYLPTALLVSDYPTPSPYAVCAGDCPVNAFQLTSSQSAFVDDLVRPLREVLLVGVFTATAAILASRLVRSTPVVRRTIVPVVAAAMFSALASGVYLAARRSGAGDGLLEALEIARGVAIPLAGLGFLVSLMMWQLYEARALERMALSSGGSARPRQLQELLSEALGDESLELRFELPGGWHDVDGNAVPAPAQASDRCVVEVGGAAIVCDPGLRAHRRLVRAAGTWVAMSSERDRLSGLLKDSLREVEASRHRLAAATATERRRIERDLHDGAQQRLVTLRVQLELVEEQLDRDPAAGVQRLRELGPSVDAVIDDVRSLARGIYPPLLADAGLIEALRAVASREGMPVTIEADGGVRYPLEIESAAYFCCLEALQNAAKHSGSESVAIVVNSDSELLKFAIHDTGCGFASDAPNGGSGLTNMRDRLAAVGGRLTVDSAPGAGTCVSGEVPVDTRS